MRCPMKPDVKITYQDDQTYIYITVNQKQPTVAYTKEPDIALVDYNVDGTIYGIEIIV
jgi:uncharacterized protein YuzE